MSGKITPFIETESDYGKYLYHYTTMEYFIMYILPQKALRMSSIRQTNDPQECLNKSFCAQSLRREENDQNTQSEINLFSYKMQKFHREFLENIKVLCFSEDRYDQYRDGLKKIRCKGLAKPRMWAQYANNHKGVVLGLNADASIKRTIDIILNNYEKKPEIFQLYYFDTLYLLSHI